MSPNDGQDHTWRRRFGRVARQMVKEWSHDRVPDLAAEVSFYAVLSLFPAVLAMASLLGVLDSFVGADVADSARSQVIDFLNRILTDDASGVLDTANELFTQSRPGLLTFSLLAALWALSRGFAALIRALDVVYDVEDDRGWFQMRLTALALAVGSVVAGAVMLSMFIVGPLFGSGQQIAGDLGVGDQFVFLWDVVRIPAAFAVLVLWASVIFHLAPDHRSPWRWDVPGALLTGVLWIVFSLGLNVYLRVAQSTNAVFGTLGGALIVLLWFWLLALAVLIGGELNEIVYREFIRPQPRHFPHEPGPEHDEDLGRGADRAEATEQRAAGDGDAAEDDGGEDDSAGVERPAETGDELAGVDGRPAVEEQPHDGRGHDDAVGGRSGRSGGGR